jgi:hypothetical protein
MKSLGLSVLASVLFLVSCGSRDAGQTSNNAAISGSPSKASSSNPPSDGGTTADCKVTNATFTAGTFHPPTTQQATACTDAIINTLADACSLDVAQGKDDPSCAAARGVPANKTCVDCIFGAKADANWKVVNLVDAATTEPNVAGCIDHVTGVPGCGAAVLNVVDCFNTFCPDTTTGGTCDATSGPACGNEVKGVECKTYLLTQECENAFTAKTNEINTNCQLPTQDAAGAKTFFVNMAKESCETAPTTTGGG